MKAVNTIDAYNSEQSVKVYANKEGLTPIEDNIFSLFLRNKDISILDLGCGAGRTTYALLEKGFKNILGIDIAEELINAAKKKNKKYSEHFLVGDACDLSKINDSSFDVVFFSFNGIDYIESREKRLKAYKEISRVLKPGGFFIFSSHNRKCLPVNRQLLFTRLKNVKNFFEEYWITKQSFGNIKTYYSTSKGLEKDLKTVNLKKLFDLPRYIYISIFGWFPLLFVSKRYQ